MMTYHTQNSYGELGSAPNGMIISKIYDYLERTIIDFSISTKENENSITDRLCKRLNIEKPSEYPFFFHHQNLENGLINTSNDMAVIATKSFVNTQESELLYFLKIEAKRLDSRLSKKRENEYVIGEYNNGVCINNSGGIERYKNGRHGANVNHACILGYIQTDNANYWFDKVNNIINSQILSSNDGSIFWSHTDLLKFQRKNKHITSYFSISSRVLDNNIYFKHLWISKIEIIS